MATDIDTNQLLIDSFQIYGKLMGAGKAWAFDAAAVGRATLTVLYGQKNNDLSDQNLTDLNTICEQVKKRWQEAN